MFSKRKFIFIVRDNILKLVLTHVNNLALYVNFRLLQNNNYYFPLHIIVNIIISTQYVFFELLFYLYNKGRLGLIHFFHKVPILNVVVQILINYITQKFNCVAKLSNIIYIYIINR